MKPWVLSFFMLFIFVAPALGQKTICLGGGIAWQDLDNHELDHKDKTFGNSHDNFDSGPALYLTVEQRLRPWFSGVLGYTYSRMEMHSRSKLVAGQERDIAIDAHALFAAVKLTSPVSGSFRPFVQVGAGYEVIATKQIGSPDGVMLQF